MAILYRILIVGLFIQAAPLHASANEVVRVESGKAHILRLNPGIRTVVVGNSDLVQVTLIDQETIVISGVALGVTNLVTMTEDGSIKADYQIVVDENLEFAATIYRRNNAERLNCTPHCRPI